MTPDYILRQPDGYTLYFGVPDGACEQIPVGGTFDLVDTQTWTKTRWQVHEGIERYGKNKGELARFYRIVRERELDPDECGVWQQVIEDWERKANGQ